MKTIAFPQELEARTAVQTRRLLIVGPKPPPIGGSPLTVQAMLAELASYPGVDVKLINTSPARDVRNKMTGFNLEKVARSVLILPQYIFEIHRCNAVLVFANDLFAITLAPVLLFVARLFRKPFFLKPVGASLDLFIDSQKKPLRNYLLAVLQAADGVLPQTQRLQHDLRNLGCTKVHYLPGCRPLARIVDSTRHNPNQLQLIFLGHVTRVKGPLVLLQALQILKETWGEQISCDFYGPIHHEIREEFLQGLESIPNAHYRGVAEPGTGPELISNYDALVLPTFSENEGHPGVIIEAMHAGVPVITTRFRTLPELVTDGVNGLLVPTHDSQALAQAIQRIAADPVLRQRMGEENRRRGREFRADMVVAQMLKIIFPNVPLAKQTR